MRNGAPSGLAATALGWLLTLGAFAEDAVVTFKVVPDTALPAGGSIFITGDHEQLGNWDPGSVPLAPEPDGAWTRDFLFPAGTRIEYKITRGKWEAEAIYADSGIPGNFRLDVSGDTQVAIRVPHWKDQIVVKRRGGITGTVITHENMAADGIVPRDVLVWLPPGYETATAKRYPVIYMHDAQQIFDPATATHGIDWQIDETLTALIREGRMREVIVVGNKSTKDRGREYSDGPQGKAYQRFIVEILKPFIDRTYRTKPEREHTSVMGSSMGGLASFLLIWHHPETFSMAGCFSPAFWLDWRQLKTDRWPPVQIYIDNGGVGLEKRLQPGCDLMLEVLQRKGFVLGKDLIWAADPDAEHNEEAWSRRAWMPVLWKYGTGKQAWVDTLPAPPPPYFSDRAAHTKTFLRVDTLTIVGISGEFTRGDREEAVAEFRERFIKDREAATAENNTGRPVYIGVFSKPDTDGTFDYMAGVLATDTMAAAERNLQRIDLPPAHYLKYTHQGPMASIPETYGYLLDWFLPKHDWTPGDYWIEWYDERYLTDSTRPEVDVYIPVTDGD
ncbi:effector binding domain-containing protein [bacterium]|nr:effector binding domain-containing protein [bacterium]